MRIEIDTKVSGQLPETMLRLLVFVLCHRENVCTSMGFVFSFLLDIDRG